VDARAFRTGGGLIIAMDLVSLKVSNLGVDIPSSTLRAWGLTIRAPGYEASRACV
jgi:hypothetical protein